MKGLEQPPYEERLRKVKLFCPELKHMKGDIIKVYKIMHDGDKLGK